MIAVFISPEFRNVSNDPFSQTATGGNRIPRQKANTAVVTTQCNRLVAFDQEQIIVDITALNSEGYLVDINILTNVCTTQIDRLHVQFNRLRLAFELGCNRIVKGGIIKAQDFSQHAYVYHVGNHSTQLWIEATSQLCHWGADDSTVVAFNG